MEPQEIKVLICDDDERCIAKLVEEFSLYNEDPAKKYYLKPTPAKNMHEVFEHLKGNTKWDVIIIDRHFKDDTNLEGTHFWNRHILRALNDLSSTALRIVFTALPNETDNYKNEDLVESMRLGAWDYIDKDEVRQPRDTGTPYSDVVTSILKGLDNGQLRKERIMRAQEALHWSRAHHSSIFKENLYEKFVPLLKRNNNDWEILEDLSAITLFTVYGNLEDQRISEKEVHIIWVPRR